MKPTRAVDLRDVLFDARSPERRIATRRFDFGIMVLIVAAIGTWGVVGLFAWLIWAWVLP
jgi:hypothetical protein